MIQEQSETLKGYTSIYIVGLAQCWTSYYLSNDKGPRTSASSGCYCMTYTNVGFLSGRIFYPHTVSLLLLKIASKYSGSSGRYMVAKAAAVMEGN